MIRGRNKNSNLVVRQIKIKSMRIILAVLLLFFGTGFAMSQKYAYIDSDYILSKIPEYKEAKEKLDKFAERWTEEIDQMYKVLKMKKDNFAREEVLLPNEEKKKRQEEINKLESEAMQMQKQRFGVSGDYFQKRQELIKPIQDRVYEALQEVASKRSYAFVFDKANQSNLVFADSKYDISDTVLKEMGVSAH